MLPFRDNRSSMDNGLLLQMKRRKAVNIFRGCNYYLTIYLSAYGKTHCFTSRKSRLQNLKVHLSPFHRIIFTKPKIFSNFLKQEKRKPTVLTSSGNPVF